MSRVIISHTILTYTLITSILLTIISLNQYSPQYLVKRNVANELLTSISNNMISAESIVRELGFNSSISIEIEFSNVYVGCQLELDENGVLKLIFDNEAFLIYLPEMTDVKYLSSKLYLFEPRLIILAKNINGEILITIKN